MPYKVISPYEAERRAIAELRRIGAPWGTPTRWKKKPQRDGRDMGYARPWRKRGMPATGRHGRVGSGHHGGKKRGGKG